MGISMWTIGCIYGATAVAAGAFGAHALKNIVTDVTKLESWRTAANYQLIHSGVLLLSTTLCPTNKLSAGLFTAGMTLFSGSIYLLVLNPQGFKFVGPITPLGGLCLIGGWISLAFGRPPPYQRSPPQIG